MSNFDLRVQAIHVANLLETCIKSLNYLPPEIKVEMEKNLAEFEECAVPVIWSVADIDVYGLDLTLDDKKEILDNLVNNYEISESENFTLQQEIENYVGQAMP